MAVRPYSHPSIPFFQQLEEAEKTRVVTTLNNYLEICRSVYKETHSLKESEFLVKKALEYFKFTCDPKIFQLLKQSGRVLEFYSLSNTQFFRTINYFEFGSYTIEDIYCRQWNHLYLRDDAVGETIFNGVMAVTSGQSTDEGIVISEEHVLTEKASLERLTIQVDEMRLMPLKKGNSIPAFACVIDLHTLFES